MDNRWQVQRPGRVIIALSASAVIAGCSDESGGESTRGEGARTSHTTLAQHTTPPSATQHSDEHGGVSHVKTQIADRALADEMALNDAARDGWPSEVLNSSSGSVLGKIFAHLNDAPDTEALRTWVVEDVQISDLRPVDAETVRSTDLVVVRSGPRDVKHTGIEALRAQISALAESVGDEIGTVKFKTVRSDVIDGVGKTKVLYLASGRSDDGLVQQNADWWCEWDLSGGVKQPRLKRIVIERFDEASHPRPYFNDCTEAMFSALPSWEQLNHGMEYWWGRLDFALGGSLSGHYGIAVGDVNNDSLDDLYICQPGLLPNRLLLHNADGTLTDVSAESGADLLNDTISALILDMDNDGSQDLVLGTVSHILVMQGNGRGQFTPRYHYPVIMTTALAAADYDNDDLIDIYVCQYAATGVANSTQGPLYDSEMGLPNILLRNTGAFNFSDVTDAVGMGVNNTRQSFAAAWEDFDNDGDQDLYVANDFGRNNLYRNDGGRFVDIAAQAGVEDQAAGMGVAWADYDNDGLMDLFVTNMFSSAGNRVTFNSGFATPGGERAASHLQYFSRGNSLFHNNGDGTFKDVSVAADITMGRFAWGAEFIDFNNDGLADVVCPNGFVTNRDSSDL